MKKQTNRNNKHLGYVTYWCTKNVTAQPIFIYIIVIVIVIVIMIMIII